jgi:hypothetical protein
MPITPINLNKHSLRYKVNQVVLYGVLAFVGYAIFNKPIGNTIFYLASVIWAFIEPFSRGLIFAVPFGITIAVAKLIVVICKSAIRSAYILLALCTLNNLTGSVFSSRIYAFVNTATLARASNHIITTREYAKRLVANYANFIYFRIFLRVMSGSCGVSALKGACGFHVLGTKLNELFSANFTCGIKSLFVSSGLFPNGRTLLIGFVYRFAFFGTVLSSFLSCGYSKYVFSALPTLQNNRVWQSARTYFRAKTLCLRWGSVIGFAALLADFEHKKTPLFGGLVLCLGEHITKKRRGKSIKPLRPTVKCSPKQDNSTIEARQFLQRAQEWNPVRIRGGVLQL